MKRFLSAVVTALFLLGAGPAPAQLPGQPVAPVPPSVPKPSWLDYQNPYVGEENDIANPHRTTDEIMIWAQQVAAEVLSLNPADYKARLGGFKKYFVQQGWQLYAAYLKDSKLIDMVSEKGYSVGTIVDSTPAIVSHAASDGAYHWIVKMPVTISFFLTDAAGNARTGATAKYTLYMDIMRVEDDRAENGIAIANWKVSGG